MVSSKYEAPKRFLAELPEDQSGQVRTSPVMHSMRVSATYILIVIFGV